MDDGDSTFRDALRDEFLTPGYIHAAIHESIFKLDSRLVATPNFDKIYETYANHQAGGAVVIKHQYDPDVGEVIKTSGRVILKIHGSIDSPDRMIFSRREYAEAREKYRSFYSILDALATTHTFLFLGCGLNDPDIRLLLEDSFFRHSVVRSHFFVLPKGLHASVKGTLENSMNLRILTYSHANNHLELTDSLQRLVDLVDLERDALRISGNW